MRIDGRFDPKAWVQPQPEDAVVSARVVEQQDEGQVQLTATDQSDANADFATELEMSYAYTHASRTVEAVTQALEKTPDL